LADSPAAAGIGSGRGVSRRRSNGVFLRNEARAAAPLLTLASFLVALGVSCRPCVPPKDLPELFAERP